MSKIGKIALAVMALGILAPAMAADIKEIKVEPALVKVGQPVKITLVGEEGASQNCGVRVEFGDGDGTDIKISSKEGFFPRTLSKTYAKPGTYAISAKGKRVTTHFGCAGEASAKLTVEGSASAAKEAAACPQGWQQVKGSAKPDGSFACQAVKPAGKIDCGPGLTYFEKGDTLGCRKAGRK